MRSVKENFCIYYFQAIFGKRQISRRYQHRSVPIATFEWPQILHIQVPFTYSEESSFNAGKGYRQQPWFTKLFKSLAGSFQVKHT